jgi:hypothetical protein
MAYGKIADQNDRSLEFRHNAFIHKKYIEDCRHFDCVANCSVSGLHSKLDGEMLARG